MVSARHFKTGQLSIISRFIPDPRLAEVSSRRKKTGPTASPLRSACLYNLHEKKTKNGLSDMSMTSVLLTSVHPGELGFNVVETIGKPYDEWGLFLAAAVVLKRSL